tara:strand:- start:4802 stop:5329 length:528 start_codon:yes stop_codon:yes gene_type:complete
MKNLEVTSIEYYETRRGIAFTAHTKNKDVIIYNDGDGSATYCRILSLDDNVRAYYKLMPSDLDALIDEFENKNQDPNVGYDICYDCGKVDNYGIFKDIDWLDFAIYCQDCRSKILSLEANIWNELNNVMRHYTHSELVELLFSEEAPALPIKEITEFLKSELKKKKSQDLIRGTL